MLDKKTLWKGWLQGFGVPPEVYLNLKRIGEESDLERIGISDLIRSGILPSRAKSFLQYRRQHSITELEEKCKKDGIKILARDTNEYPRLLKNIFDPPEVLFVKGRIDDLNKCPAIAVVGTRQVTEYGVEVTQFFVKDLVSMGFIIVSGFMYGVDAVAHKAAMEAGGRTIGVLGFGFDHMYPVQHKELSRVMLDQGQTLISEYCPWQAPSARNFPARNRIVSGLSMGVLVTEAAARSGSKITARLAAEQGREVFAVPGRYDSPYSEGTKALINLGAKLVTSSEDILEGLVG